MVSGQTSDVSKLTSDVKQVMCGEVIEVVLTDGRVAGVGGLREDRVVEGKTRPSSEVMEAIQGGHWRHCNITIII